MPPALIARTRKTTTAAVLFVVAGLLAMHGFASSGVPTPPSDTHAMHCGVQLTHTDDHCAAPWVGGGSPVPGLAVAWLDVDTATPMAPNDHLPATGVGRDPPTLAELQLLRI